MVALIVLGIRSVLLSMTFKAFPVQLLPSFPAARISLGVTSPLQLTHAEVVEVVTQLLLGVASQLSSAPILVKPCPCRSQHLPLELLEHLE